jgi:hypothetical protein
VRKFTRKNLDTIRDAAGRKTVSDRAQPLVRKQKKELSTLNIILLLIVAAAVLVGYVSNVIIVNHLGIKIHGCEESERILLLEKENLQAEIQRLCNRTRIEEYAIAKLGLVPADRQPNVLPVNGLDPDAK